MTKTDYGFPVLCFIFISLASSESEPFIAIYVFTYKEFVMAGGATIDNIYYNHSARIKNINIR